MKRFQPRTQNPAAVGENWPVNLGWLHKVDRTIGAKTRIARQCNTISRPSAMQSFRVGEVFGSAGQHHFKGSFHV